MVSLRFWKWPDAVPCRVEDQLRLGADPGFGYPEGGPSADEFQRLGGRQRPRPPLANERVPSARRRMGTALARPPRNRGPACRRRGSRRPCRRRSRPPGPAATAALPRPPASQDWSPGWHPRTRRHRRHQNCGDQPSAPAHHAPAYPFSPPWTRGSQQVHCNGRRRAQSPSVASIRRARLAWSACLTLSDPAHATQTG
jgi:hypothetical protein